MGAGGARKGAGRPRGIPNKLRKQAREEYERDRKQQGLKGALLVLSEIMNHQRSLVARYQPGAQEADPVKCQTAIDNTLRAASSLAPFEAPRLASIRVQEVPYDLSKLTDAEFAELDRLTSKAVVDADRAGEDSTRH